MRERYQKLRIRLRAQTRFCKDRDVRVKVELILLAAKLGNVSEACERRGFSRTFYHKWNRRLKRAAYNIEALREKSKKPKKSPQKTKRWIEKRVLSIHEVGYGSRMLEAMLKREGISLHRSTICHILNHRRKTKKKRKERLRAHRRRYELFIPGQRLQMDVKYVPEFVEGYRAYCYVAVDECTRWRFAWAYLDLNPKNTVDFLERLKQQVPFPIHTIQTDNGFEFTNHLIPTATHIEHPMDHWCNENTVHHRLIPPGEKELNGKVERSHRIDAQYFYWQAPTDNLDRFNEELKKWLSIYNETRPHGGIEYLTPMQKLIERYQAIRTRRIGDPKYEFHQLRFIRDLPKRLTELRWPNKLKIAA